MLIGVETPRRSTAKHGELKPRSLDRMEARAPRGRRRSPENAANQVGARAAASHMASRALPLAMSAVSASTSPCHWACATRRDASSPTIRAHSARQAKHRSARRCVPARGRAREWRTAPAPRDGRRRAAAPRRQRDARRRGTENRRARRSRPRVARRRSAGPKSR